MKPTVSTSVFTSVFASVFVSCVLLAPSRLVAQHSAGDAPSVGTAAPAGGSAATGGGSAATGGGTSSGSSSSSSSDSSSGVQSNSGGGDFFGRSDSAGHSAANSNPAARAAIGFAGGSNQVFTNYWQLSSPAPMFSRPRDDRPSIGTAVLKGSVPATSGGGLTTIEGVYNPWFYAYDRLAATPFFGVYDPLAVDFGVPDVGGTTSTRPTGEPGVLHLNIKPRDAEVYIDGVRVGNADQFEGLFHKLRLEAGVHRVELRAPGHEPIAVIVRIEAGQSMTYRGTLEKIARP